MAVPTAFHAKPLSQPNAVLCRWKLLFNGKSFAVGSCKECKTESLEAFHSALIYLSGKSSLLKT
jgi:hypothetical protein